MEELLSEAHERTMSLYEYSDMQILWLDPVENPILAFI
jgi:hypothetical protein